MEKVFNMTVVRTLGSIWILAHFFSMVVYPSFYHSFDWQEIQNVWDRWQTLNAAMIALASSLIAFQITSYKEEKQRKRNFAAARTFLPESLSDLTAYCRRSADVFKEVYELLPNNRPGAPVQAGRVTTPLTVAVPILPEGYRKVFQECILQADDRVSEYLSYILMRLQVHHSRVVQLHEKCGPHSHDLIAKQDLNAYFYRLSEIQALINSCFEFARGLQGFSASPLGWEDFKNALSNLDVWIDDYEDLEGFIKRAIARKGGD